MTKDWSCVQLPNSPLLPGALPSLLAALTTACQQGGDAALANRLRTLIRSLHKAQAVQARPGVGESTSSLHPAATAYADNCFAFSQATC